MAGPRRGHERLGISHLRISLSADCYIGPGRMDLLENIAETRSIAAAGRLMGMSYKRAWGLIQALNDGFGAPLVETSRGGAKQGGAELTALGSEVLMRYRRMQADAAAATELDFKALQELVKPRGK